MGEGGRGHGRSHPRVELVQQSDPVRRLEAIHQQHLAHFVQRIDLLLAGKDSPSHCLRKQWKHKAKAVSHEVEPCLDFQPRLRNMRGLTLRGVALFKHRLQLVPDLFQRRMVNAGARCAVVDDTHVHTEHMHAHTAMWMPCST